MKTKLILIISFIFGLFYWSACSNKYKIDPKCTLLTAQDSLSQEVQKFIHFMDMNSGKNNIAGSYFFTENDKDSLEQMIDIGVYNTFIEFSYYYDKKGENMIIKSWHFDLNEPATKSFFFEGSSKSAYKKNILKKVIDIKELQQLNQLLKNEYK